MANGGSVRSLLRPHRAHQRVTFLELFFDLVYVLAITQLSHLLVEHLSLHGAAQTLLLLLAVWWAWVYNAWFTNWFDPDHRAVRVVQLALMLTSLGMSATIPEAFGDRGLIFAVAYVFMQVGRPVFAVATIDGDDRLRRNFQRILAWAVASGVLWLAGGVAQGTVREACWVAALAVDLLAPISGFWTPGIGRSRTTDWVITGGHLAERCQLFIILALGESLLVNGRAVGDLPFSAETLAASAVAFLGTVLLWWLYFDRSAEDGGERIAHSNDPGRLGRSAYTYFHLPMVAGVIVAAVADERVIAHPGGATDPATAAVILGGPALFLAGHALYKWSVFGGVSRSRVGAIGLLVLLTPLSFVVSPLVLSSGTVVVLGAVVVADWWMLRSAPHRGVEVGEEHHAHDHVHAPAEPAAGG